MLERDTGFEQFDQASRTHMNIEATFEGRFDAVFTWREGKRINLEPSDGFGKNKLHGGRIVLRKVCGVGARPIPRI